MGTQLMILILCLMKKRTYLWLKPLRGTSLIFSKYMNKNIYTINFQLSLFYRYSIRMKILLNNDHGINWIMEDILEDLHYDELISGEWGKNLLSSELWESLTKLMHEIVTLFETYSNSGDYGINEQDFYSSSEISEIRMNLVLNLRLLKEELKKYNYNLEAGKYLDGSTYEEHLNYEPQEIPDGKEIKSSGSLIKDLIDAVKNSNNKK